MVNMGEQCSGVAVSGWSEIALIKAVNREASKQNRKGPDASRGPSLSGWWQREQKDL